MNCEFDTAFDTKLSDKFITGYNPGKVRNRLFSEKKDITYAQVLNTAVIEESAMAGILECDEEVKQEPREAELNWVSKRRVPNQEENRKTNAAIRSHTASAAGSSGLPGGWAVPGGSGGGRSANVKCFRCGKGHYANKCPYREYICNKCPIKGHLSSVCKRQEQRLHFLAEYQEAHEDVEEEYAPVLCLRQKSDKPIIVDISLNDISIKMELDSGAAMSILPLNLYRKYFVIQELSDTDVTLINFSGDKIYPEGTVTLQTKHAKKKMFSSEEDLQEFGGSHVTLNYLSSCSTLPIDIAKMKHETLLDPALKDISSYVRSGWPSNSTIAFIPWTVASDCGNVT
ncbi:hypothetical protein JTB14_031024 [Gonioctena quinquepunctata]|nr:hypothetical protein JTB14_031024 [Gonioctena quinquepunctata]